MAASSYPFVADALRSVMEWLLRPLSWRNLAIALALLNVKSLPLSWHVCHLFPFSILFKFRGVTSVQWWLLEAKRWVFSLWSSEILSLEALISIAAPLIVKPGNVENGSNNLSPNRSVSSSIYSRICASVLTILSASKLRQQVRHLIRQHTLSSRR